MRNIILRIKRNRKRLLLCFVVIILSVSAVITTYGERQGLEVVFLNVGQGDSALLKTVGGHIALIDGGPDDLVLRRLGENLPFYERHIDLIVISHYHDDHIAGLIDIINRFRVDRIVYSFGTPNSVIFQELSAVARRRGVTMTSIKNVLNISFDKNCFLDLFNPVSLGIKVDTNNSLVTKFDCQQKTFLFAGDNSELVEKALINSGQNLHSAVLKASHHGSNTANSEKFLRFVSPKLVVISVGASNKFGHPSQEVIDRFERLGIRYMRTDRQGNISIISP